MLYDIIIIGAGPAGASAGIFAARANKKVLIIDNDKSGTKKAWVENHYAVMGITGYDVFETGKKQAEKFGAEIKITEAIAIEQRDEGFHVATEDGAFAGSIVLIAAGPAKELSNKLGLKTKSGIEPGASKVIEVDGEGRTNVPGIWAAGLCTGLSMHVAITAGDGARVAINILSEMNGKRYIDHDMMC
jgi:thioredoxin reductase (NADPH)